MERSATSLGAQSNPERKSWRCVASSSRLRVDQRFVPGCGREARSDVEADVHDVAVLDGVLFALQMQQSFVARRGR